MNDMKWTIKLNKEFQKSQKSGEINANGRRSNQSLLDCQDIECVIRKKSYNCFSEHKIAETSAFKDFEKLKITS